MQKIIHTILKIIAQRTLPCSLTHYHRREMMHGYQRWSDSHDDKQLIE